MNNLNRSKLNIAVEILSVFGIKNTDIKLVGSIALDMQGLLPSDREVHDVDLIINTDDEHWKTFKNLDAISNLINRDFYPCTDNVMFKCGDVILNMWKNTENIVTSIVDKNTGIYVKPAGEILAKKKEYGRLKDFKDINDICKKFL